VGLRQQLVTVWPPAKRAVAAGTWVEDLHRFDRFIDFVASWKFVLPKKNPADDLKVRKVPSHQGWLLTLHAMRELCRELLVESKVMNYVCLRKFNQDHVENLHSVIRDNNRHNDHPLVQFYISAIRTLTCSFQTTELLVLPSSANCEPDEEAFLTSLSTPAKSCVDVQSLNDYQDIRVLIHDEFGDDFDDENVLPAGADDDSTHVSPTDSVAPALVDSIQQNVVTYMAGFVIRKLNNAAKACPECISLCLAESSLPIHGLIELKQFKSNVMYKVSESVADLCVKFEGISQASAFIGLPYPNPRSSPIDMFMKQYALFVPSLSLNCSLNHAQSLISSILKLYCNIRIHHHIATIMRKSKRKKKGSELSKLRKINQ
jgi:hypothetical protein